MGMIEEIHAFKVGNWPEDRGQLKRSWGLIHGFVGAIPWAWVVASIPRRIGLSLASILLQRLPRFSPRSRHDRTTIGPRSGVDRGVSDSSIAVRSTGDNSTAKSPRSWLQSGRDCGVRSVRPSVRPAPRSRFDRAVIVEFLHKLPTSSDWNPTLQRSSQIGADRGSPGRKIGIRRSRDLHEERRIALHVAIGSMKSGRLDGLDCAINVAV